MSKNEKNMSKKDENAAKIVGGSTMLVGGSTLIGSSAFAGVYVADTALFLGLISGTTGASVTLGTAIGMATVIGGVGVATGGLALIGIGLAGYLRTKK